MMVADNGAHSCKALSEAALLLALLAQINWLQLKLQLCSELQIAAALLHLMIDFALMHSRFCALQV